MRNVLLLAHSAFLAALLLIGPSVSQAQVINGRVLEVGTDRPIVGASLRLYDDKGVTQAIAIADGSGTFTLRAPRAGQYRVRAERIGYATSTSVFFEVRSDPPMSMTVTLAPHGITLDTLRVTAESLVLEPGHSQFRRRCKAETANCFSSARIARTGATRVSDVFESVSGFAVRSEGALVAAGQRKYQPNDMSRQATRVRSPFGWGCFVILLDHHGRLTHQDLNEIDLDDVAGIEIYASYREVPTELRQSFFASQFWGCGVGIVWRKPAWGLPVPAAALPK